MRLSNETPIPIVGNIDGRWYEIPVGETTEIDDYVVASTLVEYGATANLDELQAARTLWGEQNRAINSASASASASEGAILGRRQATVDVQSGTVTTSPEPLAGAALKAAVEAANEGGAQIKSSLTADEKRDALATWQAKHGSSTSVGDEGVFLVDADGDVVLDEDDQPYRLDELELDEDGNVVYDEDGKPVVKALEPVEASAGEGDGSEVDAEKEATPGTGGDPSAGTGGDGAGPDQGPTDPADPAKPAEETPPQ